MKFLKSHNDYLCGYKDQITKSYRYYTLNKLKEKYDDLIVEVDVIYSKSKVRLAHEESKNPLKINGIVGWSGEWHGSLKDYLNIADNYKLNYVMVEFKDHSKDCFKNTMVLLNRHSKITFLCLGYDYPLTLKNTIDYRQFEAQHIFDTKDFY